MFENKIIMGDALLYLTETDIFCYIQLFLCICWVYKPRSIVRFQLKLFLVWFVSDI